MKHTGTFTVEDENGKQYTVHEMTEIIMVPPIPGKKRPTEKDGDKRYELPDSPGAIKRLDGNTFRIKFPFAKTVTATVV